MADIKSLQSLLIELKTFLRAKAKSLDVSDNSLISDLILNAYAVGGKVIMDQVSAFKNLHILSTLTNDDLDSEATNFMLERSPGSYASVYLVFYTYTRPTNNVTIPSSTQARTTGTPFSSPMTFTVNSDYMFPLDTVDAYYSFDRSRYEFRVLATCDTVGRSGVVGSNIINELVTSVSQIDGVTNLTGSYGGEDQEIDDSLAERVRLANVGRNKNVIAGVNKYLRDLGFDDSYTVRAGDEDAEKASGVDAFIIDYSSEQASDVFVYYPFQQRYYFTLRPVTEVTSVISDTGGAVSSGLWDVVIDHTTPMRRSVNSYDYIEFAPSVALLPGTRITVTYNYSSKIKVAQEDIIKDSNKILTSDVLLKRAYPLYMYINAQITLKANADGPATRNSVKNALAQFLATYTLGQDVQKSDLIVVLQNGYGDYPVESVDAVVISQYYLQDEYGNSYTPVNEVISVNNKQHVVYGSSSIV